jgi:hypothetical protein
MPSVFAECKLSDRVCRDCLALPAIVSVMILFSVTSFIFVECVRCSTSIACAASISVCVVQVKALEARVVQVLIGSLSRLSHEFSQVSR